MSITLHADTRVVVVPVAIVFVWGPSLADFSKLFGGSGDRAQIEAATAGWAAAALAGLAGFFQVTGARATDRRLAAEWQRLSADHHAAQRGPGRGPSVQGGFCTVWAGVRGVLPVVSAPRARTCR